MSYSKHNRVTSDFRTHKMISILEQTYLKIYLKTNHDDDFSQHKLRNSDNIFSYILF